MINSFRDVQNMHEQTVINTYSDKYMKAHINMYLDKCTCTHSQHMCTTSNLMDAHDVSCCQAQFCTNEHEIWHMVHLFMVKALEYVIFF